MFIEYFGEVENYVWKKSSKNLDILIYSYIYSLKDK